MDYINIRIAIPLFVYLELENQATRKNITKNEIIIDAILRRKSTKEKDFGDKKMCRI